MSKLFIKQSDFSLDQRYELISFISAALTMELTIEITPLGGYFTVAIYKEE